MLGAERRALSATSGAAVLRVARGAAISLAAAKGRRGKHAVGAEHRAAKRCSDSVTGTRTLDSAGFAPLMAWLRGRCP